MDPLHQNQNVTYNSSLFAEFEYAHPVSAWIATNDFIVLGSFSGSLFFYKKDNLQQNTLVASSDLMDPITKIQEAYIKDNVYIFLVGTKEGNVAAFRLVIQDKVIVNWMMKFLIQKMGQEVIDVFVSRSPECLIAVFTHTLVIFSLRVDVFYHVLIKYLSINNRKMIILRYLKERFC